MSVADLKRHGYAYEIKAYGTHSKYPGEILQLFDGVERNKKDAERTRRRLMKQQGIMRVQVTKMR